MGDLAIQPADEALRREYRELLKTVSGLIYLRDNMLQNEEPFLTALYLKEVGGLQYQILVLQMDIKALNLRRTLLQKYINRDETPDLNEIDSQLEDFLTEAEKIINSRKEELTYSQDYLTHLIVLTKEESEEMKHLYQSLVKRLHPDLNPNQTDAEKALLLEVIEAYKAGDLDKMRGCFLKLGEETILEKELGGSLEKEVARLRKRARELSGLIDRMNEIFPFIHREHLRDEEWIRTEQEQLKAEIAELKAQKETLAEIVSLMEEYESRGL